jgi:isoquinoline 1-oxidoreductase beta subunit
VKTSRRRLLAAGGLLAVFGAGGCALVPPIPKRPTPQVRDALGWLQIDAQGRVTLWCPRMEMGQGIGQALRQVVAQSLQMPPAAVAVRMPSTADIALVKATVGSDSVRELAPLLQQACALLRERAAAQGLVIAADAVAARDDAALVTGAAAYTADIRLPDMLYACVLRPPWRSELGPVLQSLDEAAVRGTPGVVALLRLPQVDGPVIVARHPGALWAAQAAAQPNWGLPKAAGDPMRMIDVDTALRQGRITKDRGRVADGAWTIDQRLDIPPAAHAAIEPRCALAHWDANGTLQLWCGTQDPFYVRDVLARDHQLPPERVLVHAMRLGGSFGARTIATVEREAAFVAQAMGAPVQLQWSREDEFHGGFHRPPSSHRVRVRLDADGRISDWWHTLSSSHVLFTNAALPPWMQRLTDLVGDDGTARGQTPPYRIQRLRLQLTLTRLPIATGPWRGLGAGPNVLAIESAMDAAARASGQDPVAFRLRHLDSGDATSLRLATVLQRADKLAGPPAPAVAGQRLGRGVACGIYKGHSKAAAVAEVQLEGETIRVRRLVCSHDCGRIVDAAGVRAMVEGNLVWSIGLVLDEELSAAQGRPGHASLAAYRMPRIDAMPLLDIDLVDSDTPPGGAGETAIVAGAGAIFNAIAAATGQRPQRLPVRIG